MLLVPSIYADARYIDAVIVSTGHSKNNDDFAYWFSIDYGGQGARQALSRDMCDSHTPSTRSLQLQ